jgi:hypothetical protein
LARLHGRGSEGRRLCRRGLLRPCL